MYLTKMRANQTPKTKIFIIFFPMGMHITLNFFSIRKTFFESEGLDNGLINNGLKIAKHLELTRRM